MRSDAPEGNGPLSFPKVALIFGCHFANLRSITYCEEGDPTPVKSVTPAIFRRLTASSPGVFNHLLDGMAILTSRKRGLRAAK
jgi:hypothetical protein